MMSLNYVQSEGTPSRLCSKRRISFDAGSLYVLTTRFEFGEYDFDRNLFPLNALTESSYFSYSNRRTLNSYTLPSSFKFGFRNPGMIGDLSIDEAGVKAFVQSRKDRYVKVNRKVYAMIYFIGLETG